jgi:hypothetical protein
LLAGTAVIEDKIPGIRLGIQLFGRHGGDGIHELIIADGRSGERERHGFHHPDHRFVAIV